MATGGAEEPANGDGLLFREAADYRDARSPGKAGSGEREPLAEKAGPADNPRKGAGGMSWIVLAGVVVGIPVLVVLALALFGLFVPKARSATRTVSYAASADEVWGTITDWEQHPSWRPRVRAMERLPDRNGHPVWKEVRRRGDKVISEVVTADAAQRRLLTRIVDEPSFGGTWTWTVTGLADGGSTLTITEEGEVYNPVFRALSALFFDPRMTMDRLHRDLKARFGEPQEALGEVPVRR